MSVPDYAEGMDCYHPPSPDWGPQSAYRPDPVKPGVNRIKIASEPGLGRVCGNCDSGCGWQSPGTGSARECDCPCCRRADTIPWSDLIQHHHGISLVFRLTAGKVMRSINSFVKYNRHARIPCLDRFGVTPA
ncbi:MAG: hypothetical protein OXK72_03725 [Gammaproteobacteria bacterium]|nr:hypothetical protein [Gammaproteobacteria bacterium]